MSDRKAPALWNREIVSRASIDCFVKLDPRVMIKNPVMFVVEVTSVLVMFTLIRDTLAHKMALAGFEFQIALWLWFTVLFANFAEAMAEGRGKAQADNLRRTRTETQAKLIVAGGETKLVPAAQLRRDDVVMVAAGDVIPGDGEVIEGIAAVNEAAITGESAPVIRESGGDRSGVTGGTTVISDWIKVKITANPGETFLDRMIALVEGAQRQKTPNEIALSILLSGLTIVFLLVDRHALSVRPVRRHEAGAAGASGAAGMPDSDDHRRPAVRYRNRRDGSPGAAQCARDVGPRGRSGRRRRHAAARQDRNDHARQPDGGGVHPGGRRVAARNWPRPRNSRRSQTRRRKDARSSCWPSANTACAAANWARTARPSFRFPRKPG